MRRWRIWRNQLHEEERSISPTLRRHPWGSRAGPVWFRIDDRRQGIRYDSHTIGGAIQRRQRGNDLAPAPRSPPAGTPRRRLLIHQCRPIVYQIETRRATDLVVACWLNTDHEQRNQARGV